MAESAGYLEVVSRNHGGELRDRAPGGPSPISSDARRGEEMKTSTAILLGVAAYGGVYFYLRYREKKAQAEAAKAAADDLSSGFGKLFGGLYGMLATQPAAVDCTKPSTDAERTYCAGIRQTTAGG
ncbi:MAG: hypothetical protein EBU52_15965 [Cytophagia bacterium]|nr:hypothetical protein [Cytophagia bacterium]